MKVEVINPGGEKNEEAILKIILEYIIKEQQSNRKVKG